MKKYYVNPEFNRQTRSKTRDNSQQDKMAINNANAEERSGEGRPDLQYLKFESNMRKI